MLNMMRSYFVGAMLLLAALALAAVEFALPIDRTVSTSSPRDEVDTVRSMG
jgi:hypothetical protein